MSTQTLTESQVEQAITSLADRLAIVDIEPSVGTFSRRVLAQEIVADRDSPAADVSAMDGFAIRLSNLQTNEPVPFSLESVPGSPPPIMPQGEAVCIFTGAVVPAGADAVVRREDTEELVDSIRFRQPAMSTRAGDNIRRAGENAKAGSTILVPGTRLTAAHRAAIANFGYIAVDVYAPVRVSIITTGDEIGLFAAKSPKPWQLRDSNRVVLTSLLDTRPWINVEHVDHNDDERISLAELVADRLAQSDAVLITGGVSMGDYDFVPDVVREVDAETVFHGLPIRPGKPILGAATADGKLILGLPGNPVSATVCCRRFAIPLLAKMSGQSDWNMRVPSVTVTSFGDTTLPLHWLRLVRWVDNGVVEIVDSQGSGDLVSLAHSDGFIECPPNASGNGPWPFHDWK